MRKRRWNTQIERFEVFTGASVDLELPVRRPQLPACKTTIAQRCRKDSSATNVHQRALRVADRGPRSHAVGHSPGVPELQPVWPSCQTLALVGVIPGAPARPQL